MAAGCKSPVRVHDIKEQSQILRTRWKHNPQLCIDIVQLGNVAWVCSSHCMPLAAIPAAPRYLA
eukprot:739326-Amphidinium_carterae.1